MLQKYSNIEKIYQDNFKKTILLFIGSKSKRKGFAQINEHHQNVNKTSKKSEDEARVDSAFEEKKFALEGKLVLKKI